VPLRFWFAPGSQLCVIDRDRECWRGAPAAMLAVLMILAITTIAGALRSDIRGGSGRRRRRAGGSAARGGDPQFFTDSQSTVAVAEAAAERIVGPRGAVVPGQGDDPRPAGFDLL
jgi:hypothetical protein